MSLAYAGTFAPMNLGGRIEQVCQESGISKQTFAERIGVHRNSINNLFQGASVDSILLKKISSVLDYNFFDVLSLEFESSRAKKKGKVGLSVVREPEQKPAQVRIIVEMDSNDPNSRQIAADLVERIQGTKKK